MKLTAKVLVPILAVSLTQIARAVGFTSVVLSGNWSNPTSWDAGAGAPDTYVGDNATIAAGDVINYDDIGGGVGSMSTPAGLVGAGGFAISNGNSVTIDGGMLTQTTLTQEMRVGEGTGGGTHSVLIIGTGGVLDTGASIGLVVGTKISGATAGDGQLDLNDGLLKLGLGAASGGLGVGVDASTGVMNVGDGIGSSGSAVVDLLTNNVQMGIGANPHIALGGGTGTVTVNSDGLVNYGTGNIFVGQGGGTGTLTLLAGGKITGTGGALLIGQDAGSTGTLVNAGTIGTAVTSTGEVRIGGGGGTGTFTMTAGTLTTTGEFNIGRDASSTGTGTLSGGAVSVGGQFDVGRDSGHGTFTMTGGSVATTGQFVVGQNSGAANAATISAGTVTSANETRVGEGTGGVGTLNISGTANFTSGGELQVGNDAGTGTMNMSGGTMTINQWGAIGRNGGTGVLNFSGGTIQMGGSNRTFDIGVFGGNGVAVGTGTMNQTGGTLINTTNDTTLGRDGSGVGVWNLNGGTASLATLFVGRNGMGTMTQSGGTLNLNNSFFRIADGGSTGHYTITAGTVSNVQAIQVGTNGNSTGTLDVSFTNPADALTAGAIYLGNDNATAAGFINVNNGALHSTGVVQIGRFGGTGTLNVTGATSSAEGFFGGGNDFFRVGMGGGHGIVNVNAGGKINTNAGWFTLGENDNSTGIATFDGAGTTLTTHGIIVGWNGSGVGTLTIQNNAVVTNTGTDHELSIARDNANTQGTVNINSGGVLNASRDVRIGANGIGTVNINGGTLNSAGGWAIVGDGGSSNGTVNLASGAFNHPNDNLFIANNPGAHGTFNQSGGTTNIGNELNLARDRSFGTLNVSGGVFNVNGWTTIGRDNNGNVGGLGTINVSNGGVFQHLQNGGDFLLGWKSGSSAQLNVSAGGTVNYNWWVRAAVDPGSTAAITVDGAGSLLHSDQGRMLIGESGNATLTITNGGAVTRTNSDWFVAGGNDGANSAGVGTVNISGANSLLTSNNFIAFGRGRADATHLATGTLNMTSGTISSTGSWIGFGTDQGTGTANISGTATGSSAGETITGRGVNSTGTFNLSGTALWTSGGEFQVGNDGGTGVANISGGTLNLLSYLAIGRNTGDAAGSHGGNGTVNLSGTGVLQKVSGGGSFDVGSWNGGNNATTNTSGTLNQTGGSVVIANNTSVYVGRDSGVSGHWIITGGTVSAAVGEFRVHNSGGAANDVMSVGGAGAFSLVAANNSYVGEGGGGGTGTLNITNPNASFTFNSEFWVGNDGGNGTMNMSAGSITANSWFDIGRNGATGVVNFTGGTITKLTGTGSFDIGSSGGGGNGTLNQSGTAALINTAAETDVGRENPSVGHWNMSGGTATVATLNIARDGGSTGVFALSGGTYTQTAGDMNVGNNGNGTFTISNSGIVAATVNNLTISPNNGSVGVLTVGGTGAVSITASDHIVIGGNGTANGTLNISNPNATISSANRIELGVGGSHGEVHQSAGTVSQNGQWFSIANGGGGSSGLYDISGGHLISAGGFEVGSEGAGTLTVSGTGLVTANGIQAGVRSPGVGVINVSGNGSIANTGELVLGGGQGTSTGTLNQIGTSTVTANGFYVGDRNGASTGTANILGGTFTNHGGTEIGGNNAGATGTVNVSNTAVYSHPEHGNDMQIGFNGGNGTVNVSSGGTLSTNWWVNIGRGGGSVGVVNVGGAGSTFTVGDGQVNVGEDGTGSMNVTNGGKVWLQSNQDFVIARNGGSTGTVNVTTGGSIQAQFLRTGGGTAQLNLDNGILKANANEGDFLRGLNPANSNILAGGVTFDSNTFNITANNQMAGVGGLTKISNGTLTLTAQNLYSGGTAIHGGTVNINGDAALGAAAGGVLIDNNAIVQAAAPVTTSRTITLGAGGGTIDTNGNTVILGAGSTVTGAATIALTHTGAGNLDIKGTQTYAILNANGGLTTLDSALGTGTSTLNANATTQINVSQTLGALNIADGVEVTFGDGLAFAPVPPKASAPFGGGGAGLVPEPGSLGLLLVGALGFIARRRRSR